MPVKLQTGLFIFLLVSLGFCGGMFIGSLFISKTNGFSGSATLFLYGIAGLSVGLVAGIFITRILKRNAFEVALIIAVVVSLLMAGWIIYRIKTLNGRVATTDLHQYNKKNTPSFLQAAFLEKDEPLPSGMGMAKPYLSHGKVIYFYHLLPIGAQPYMIRPSDSILIHKKVNQFEIVYAPPWFYPEVMKLDYDMLYLRTLTVSKDWLEVIVNKQTGQSYWIAAHDAAFIDWPEFLLNVYDIELHDPETNPVRLKPLDDASTVATTPERFSLRPLAVKNDWIMVATLGLADRIVPYGWVRWRKEDKLLIIYSLLS
jgi:hypothetical protein